MIKIKKQDFLQVGLLFLSFLLNSCFTANPIELRSIENAHIATVDNLPVIEFDVRIYNPNNWGLRLQKLESDILINNSQMGKGELAKPVHMPKKSEIVCHIHIVPDQNGMSQLLSIGFASLMGNGAMTGEVKGTITLRKFIFRKKIEFDLNQRIDNNLMK